jgi:hypothetical protein
MATIREYFDTDLNRCLSAHADWQMTTEAEQALPPVRARISQDFDANAKYWSFFIPEGVDVVEYANAIFNAPETKGCVLSRDGDAVYVEMGFADYTERATSDTLVFTKRVFLYVDHHLSQHSREALSTLGKRYEFHVLVRDREYAEKRSALQKPMAFISHDTRDKDSLVRELALEMSKLMCRVWYDEYSLKVGDSLRASIEQGLRESSRCVIVLSPNFLSNKGWGKAEFDSIYTREILEKRNVMLPIWHNVDACSVYEYCPRLADKFGLSSDIGPKELARKLVNVIKTTQNEQ